MWAQPPKSVQGTKRRRLQLGKHEIFLPKKLTMTISVRVSAAGRMNFSLCHQTPSLGPKQGHSPGSQVSARCDMTHSGLSRSRRDGHEPAAARPLPPRPGPAPSPLPPLSPSQRSPRRYPPVTPPAALPAGPPPAAGSHSTAAGSRRPGTAPLAGGSLHSLPRRPGAAPKPHSRFGRAPS